MVYIALTLFLAGTLIGATAKNFTLLLIGRMVQGIGGGGVVSLTDVVITDLVPLRLRGNYVGIISSQWAIGSVVGPVIGKNCRHFMQTFSLTTLLTNRGWLCSEYLVAMDPVHQFAVHHRGLAVGVSVSRTEHATLEPSIEAPSHRLHWHAALCRQHHQLTPRSFMGRNPAPLGFGENSGTDPLWSRWHRGLHSVRGILVHGAIDPALPVQQQDGQHLIPY
jgi:hypothetical protein